MTDKEKERQKEKIQYNNEYNRQNYKLFSVRFNTTSEKKIISWLQSKQSLKEYITDLIIQDMNKHTSDE